MPINPLDLTTSPGESHARRMADLEARVASLEQHRPGIPFIWFSDSEAEGDWYASNSKPGTVAITKPAGSGNPLHLAVYAEKDVAKKAGWWYLTLNEPT